MTRRTQPIAGLATITLAAILVSACTAASSSKVAHGTQDIATPLVTVASASAATPTTPVAPATVGQATTAPAVEPLGTTTKAAEALPTVTGTSAITPTAPASPTAAARAPTTTPWTPTANTRTTVATVQTPAATPRPPATLRPASVASTPTSAPRVIVSARGSAGEQPYSNEQLHSLKLHNEARIARGLTPLVLDARINLAAQRHAQDMAVRGYLAHVSPEGKKLWDRMREAGASFAAAAENIGAHPAGAGSSAPAIERLFDMMMAESPPNDGHQVNILSRTYRRLGVGAALSGSGQLYWVCDYAD